MFVRLGVVAKILDDEAEGEIVRHEAEQVVARGGGRGGRKAAEENDGQSKRTCEHVSLLNGGPGWRVGRPEE